MALVPCRECGAEISAAAPTCPKCGVPSPAGKTASLVVTRERRLTGAILLMWVGIEGRGKQLSGGQSVSFDLAPGEHQLEVGFGGDDLYEYEFEVAPGESKRAVVAIGKGVRFE